eukprot:m.340214 g.340214  ORF g.340214 m.340214 type:complete len:360 (+) comp27825_c1_seq5:204-1283(+)
MCSNGVGMMGIVLTSVPQRHVSTAVRVSVRPMLSAGTIGTLGSLGSLLPRGRGIPVSGTAPENQFAENATDTDTVFAAINKTFERSSCTHVYLDVGTNIGVQIRKLYQPHLYPGKKGRSAPGVLGEFDDYFGPTPRCNTVCTFGFEPNPRHYSHNDELQQKLRAAGAPVVIFNTAAHTSNTALTFNIPKGGPDAYEDWGASADPVAAWSGTETVKVHAIDLSAVIHLINHNLNHAGGDGGRPLSSKIVMKLDVEGSEESVLPHLLLGYSLCLVDRIFIEFHTRFWVPSQVVIKSKGHEVGQYHSGSRVKAFLDAENSALLHVLEKNSSDCRLSISKEDDESYLHDGIPWEASTVCSRPK